MIVSETIVKAVHAALELEPGVNLHRYPVKLAVESGALVVEGEVESIAAKKIALEVAGAVPGAPDIIDRLRVVPSEPMQDGAITDRVCRALLQEKLLDSYAIRAFDKGGWMSVRETPGDPFGVIEVEVADGVVTLNGRIGSWSQKRLAGVLAWWVAGTRDVVNGLEIFPPEEDNDDEVVDAVRLVLEENPFVNASQIRVTCRDYVVTLDGVVPGVAEKEMAEADAWAVFRVNRVINRIEVLQ